jgi:hypothetical protein
MKVHPQFTITRPDGLCGSEQGPGALGYVLGTAMSEVIAGNSLLALRLWDAEIRRS